MLLNNLEMTVALRLRLTLGAYGVTAHGAEFEFRALGLGSPTYCHS